ncbi:MAG: DUF4336 domain-containing protein [Myxococcales bacterium]|nr:DUF4336 domain-containing protein [Myxococcales bacterium]
MTISAAAIESVARPFGPDIWTVEGDPVRLLTIPFTTRMTIVRLPGGGLWMHSPVAPARARALAIGALGELRHVVAPNRFHNLFVGPWLEEHPDATSWAGPGLAERCPQLRVDHVLTDEAPAAWREVIDQVVFRGSRFIEEVMFVHRPSRTLIVTDLIQNHDPARESWFWRWIKRWNGILAPGGGVPRDWRATVRDREAARRSLARVLEWDFDRVILSHGLCIEQGGHDYVARAFDWLSPVA